MSADSGHDDGWADQLSALRVGAPPGRSMLEAVGPQVRRRRTRRRAGVAGGVAALVAAVVLVPTALLTGSDGDDVQPAPVPEAPFSCPATADHLLAGEPWPDVEQQQRNAVLVADQTDWADFFVDHAEASPVGVVALVSGDLRAARQTLPAYGVEVVAPMPAGADEAEVEELVESLVWDAVWDFARDLERSLDPDPAIGPVEVEGALEAGRVVVQAAAPVPEALAVLDGVRQGGLAGNSIGIVVLPVRFPPDVVDAALDRLTPELAFLDGGTQVVGAGSCADGSGLVVYATPPLGDVAALQERLTEAAGLPVMALDRQAALEEANGGPSAR